MLRFLSVCFLSATLFVFSTTTASAAPKKKNFAAQQAALAEAVLAIVELRELPDNAASDGVLVDPYVFDGVTYYWCQVGNTYYNCRFYDCSSCGSAAQ